MVCVTLEGWEPGLNKVQLNHLLRQHAHVGLAEAKRTVDHLLAGEQVTFSLSDSESAAAFCSSAKAIGALCSFTSVESEASLA
jgi:hypothetical protein